VFRDLPDGWQTETAFFVYLMGSPMSNLCPFLAANKTLKKQLLMELLYTFYAIVFMT